MLIVDELLTRIFIMHLGETVDQQEANWRGKKEKVNSEIRI